MSSKQDQSMMRSARDRLRHTILYEVCLLALSIPLLSILLGKPVARIGGMGIMFSLIAMGWNYLYNLGFDKSLLALSKPLYPRGFWLRTIHAVLFELGFMGVSIPMVMMILNYGFWQALALDVGFLIGVPIYTFIYNWIYDLVFPVPVLQLSETKE